MHLCIYPFFHFPSLHHLGETKRAHTPRRNQASAKRVRTLPAPYLFLGGEASGREVGGRSAGEVAVGRVATAMGPVHPLGWLVCRTL